MTDVRFKQVDVFTERPFLGNPVAVVLDAAGLSTEQMQQIARWTNLSETTFVLPSATASYRLRIFTPVSELPFAGHPTIGSAHAVIEAGIIAPAGGELSQECVSGRIPLRVLADGSISARVPAPKVLRDQPADPARLSTILGAPVEPTPVPVPVDVGAVWLIARVTSPQALASAKPDLAAIADLTRGMRGVTGISAFAIDDTPGVPKVQVRSFAPADGIDEDPVCGSGNAAVGAYLGATGLLAQTGGSYVAAQGMQVGRDGRVAVEVRGPDHVEIGGHAVTVVDGMIRLD